MIGRSSNRSICLVKRGAQSINTWVTGFAKASSEERQLIINKTLLPQLDVSSEIAQDLTKSVGGILAAIQLRNDLQKNSDPGSSYAKLDELVQNWLSVAFCVDSLSLQQITFDSSGSALELIARADTVHSVRSISALKKRLQKRRRCYALFHGALPNFPLAFIHVALTNDLAYSMRYVCMLLIFVVMFMTGATVCLSSAPSTNWSTAVRLPATPCFIRSTQLAPPFVRVASVQNSSKNFL